MLYYKIPIADGFTYPRGCVLRRAYPYSTFMYCEFESVTSVETSWVTLTEENFLANCPNVVNNPPDYVESVIAMNTVFSGGNIVATLPRKVHTGTVVKFKAPCSCGSLTGGLSIDGTVYTIVDSLKRPIKADSRIWDSNSLISVIIDQAQNYAFVQNGNDFACNVTISKNEPTDDVGLDGDIWYVYSE